MAVTKMVPEVKALFVEALESGNYTQVSGMLRARNIDGSASYCCLGVLSELAVEAGIVKRAKISSDGYEVVEDETSEAYADVLPDGTLRQEIAYLETSSLTPGVQEWSGLTDVGMLPSGGSLIDLNDNMKYSFNRIAAVIREQF